MKEKENKYCIVCGKLLVLNQKKYCSKACEISDKKGKKIGPYGKDRVDAMARAKRAAYEERYLNSYKPLIEEYLSYNYINNTPQLAEHLNMPLVNLRKYFKYYPEKKKLLKETPNYPVVVQKYSPADFLSFKQKLINLDINSQNIRDLASESNISIYAVLKSLLVVRPNQYDDIMYFRELRQENYEGEKIHFRPRRKYSSEIEKEEKSPSNQYKYLQVKKLFERDHVEDLFKDTLFFRERKDYKNYLMEVAGRYGCMWKLLARYLNEKGVKPKLNYNLLITRENICNRLEMTWEGLSLILDKLRKETSYVELYSQYRELYENHFKGFYAKNYKKYSLNNYIRDMEVADNSGYLISLKKEFYEKNDGANTYLLLKLGSEKYGEFLQDVKNLRNVDDFVLYINKYKDTINIDSRSYIELTRSLNPDYKKISDAYFGNKLSKEGGSSIEKKIIEFLKEEDIEFETQVPLKGDKKYSVYHIDILIEGKKAIEIQGDYWHGNPCFYYLNSDQLKFVENSVFPGFIYENTLFQKRKDLNERQLKVLNKDSLKKEKMREAFGDSNLYYIWEYDIENNFEEVKKFLRSIA